MPSARERWRERRTKQRERSVQHFWTDRERLSLVALAFALAGCERGCAKSAIDQARQSAAAPVSSQSFPLNAVDCPDGLARCRDGVAEASRLFAYPVPCTGPAEKCSCPWDRLGPCDRGCVVEDVVLDVPREEALLRVCAPNSVDGVATAPPSDAGTALVGDVCDAALVRCNAGLLVACDSENAAPRVLAACARGCAEDGQVVDDARVSRDQAVALLCKRR